MPEVVVLSHGQSSNYLNTPYCHHPLKLPVSQLQYFVHSLVSTNPSQGIYGGIGAAVFDRC